MGWEVCPRCLGTKQLLKGVKPNFKFEDCPRCKGKGIIKSNSKADHQTDHSDPKAIPNRS